MLNRLSRKILGLDIKPDSVSAVLVKSTVKGPWLEYFKYIGVTDTMKENGDVIRTALQTIASEIDLTGAVCIASYSFDHLSFRTLTVPFKDKKKIRQILPFELETLLPFRPDDLIMDFKILDDHTGSSGTNIIAAAIQINALKTFLDELKSGGVNPEAVAIAGYAAALLLASKSSDDAGDWALIDMEPQKASVYICISGRIKTMRTFPLPHDADEKASHISQRIRQALPAFGENPIPGDLPSWHIFITGTGSADDVVQGLLEKQLNTTVHRLNLIEDAHIRLVNPPGSSFVPLQLDNALALCLMEMDSVKSFNFRKGPFAPKNFWAEHTPDIIRSSIFAVVVLCLLFAGFIVETNSIANKVDRIDRQIRDLFSTAFPNDKITNDPLGQMKVKIRDEKKPMLFDDEAASNVRTIDIINDISKSIPKDVDVVVTKLVISPGNVVVSGTTGTFNSVDDMKNRLEQAELFTSVTITSANLDRSGNRVDFKLKIQTI